ncbi:MAG: LemA family protein [Alphaproteobacteria bacterium]|nr:LemA family protein [Alphaproteobacteria bacterium]
MGTTGWIVIGVVVVLVLWGILLYNGLVAGRNQVEAAWRQIDVQLKRRRDLIPNLVETVKGYMGYEQETLQAVIKARNAAVAAEGGPREGQIQAEAALGATLGRLFALAESYPDLKANQNAMQLQEELTSTENKIAFSRQHYNDSVMAQNTRVESFPAVLVAGPLGFGKHPYFEAGDQDREVPQVKLR